MYTYICIYTSADRCVGFWIRFGSIRKAKRSEAKSEEKRSKKRSEVKAK